MNQKAAWDACQEMLQTTDLTTSFPFLLDANKMWETDVEEKYCEARDTVAIIQILRALSRPLPGGSSRGQLLVKAMAIVYSLDGKLPIDLDLLVKSQQ